MGAESFLNMATSILFFIVRMLSYFAACSMNQARISLCSIVALSSSSSFERTKSICSLIIVAFSSTTRSQKCTLAPMRENMAGPIVRQADTSELKFEVRRKGHFACRHRNSCQRIFLHQRADRTCCTGGDQLYRTRLLERH